MKKEEGGIVESLGRLIGYCYILPISFIGLPLIIYGLVEGSSIGLREMNGDVSLTGSGLFSGMCVLSGVILQATKRFNRGN